MSLKLLVSRLLPIFAVLVFAAVGCDNPPETDHKEDTHAHDDDHGHDHPAHGPNGGHIFPTDSDEFQFEWKKYNDNNVTKVYALDKEGKANQPIAATSLVITPKVGEGDVKFELEAENADENGLAAAYMLDDSDLKMAIPLGVDIEIKIGDKVIKGEVKAHKPLDH